MKTIEDALLEQRSRLRLEHALPFKVYAALTVSSWVSKDKKYIFPRASREYATALMALLAPNNPGTCEKAAIGGGVHFLVSLGYLPMNESGPYLDSMYDNERERLEGVRQGINGIVVQSN